MPISSNGEIIQDFIAELKNYIPTLAHNIDCLREDPDQKDALEELHRLVHTIKGASSLVGITGLSQIALRMEETLDDIMAGALSFTDELFSVMTQTVVKFETYSIKLIEGDIDEQSLLEETIAAFRSIRNLSSDGDPKDSKPAVSMHSEDPMASNENKDKGIIIEDILLAADDIPVSDLPEDVRPASEKMAVVVDSLSGIDEFAAPLDMSVPVSDPEGIVDSVETDNDEIFQLPQDELLESFYQEAEGHLQDLGQVLVALESQVTDRVKISSSHREHVRQIRRSVHTIKGAAAIMGVTEVSSWAHHVEDLLDWLFEEALEITPEIIAILAESSDLLEQIVTNPKDIDAQRIDALKEQFKLIAGTRSDQLETEISDREPDLEVLQNSESERPVNEQVSVGTSPGSFEANSTPLPPAQSNTLRVDMGRVDSLVNLVGELIIAFSASDQKIETLLNSIEDLDRSRHRLKESARDLEVGYEVKAIQNLGTTVHVPAVTSATPALAERDFDDFDLLELDRYSEFNLIIRTLNETVVDVGAINTQLSNFHSDFDGYLNQQRVLLSELQDKIMRIRMMPMTIITNRLYRTVRETAAKLGKQVRLVIQGEDIELDRMVWEKLSDPLMHLLRNAVDHGIEPPELRHSLGKPPVGTVKVMASYQGNQVVIRITDDGGGLDYMAIREKARLAGLADKLDERSNEELASLIFQPGFSTRRGVSEVSGRGVGMDVVKGNITELKGTVRVAESQDGQGTQFYLRIPLTLAVVRALLFRVGDRIYAMALSEIKEILRIHPDNIVHQPQEAVRIDDTLIPLYYLSDVLNIQDNEGNSSAAMEHPLTLVVDTGDWLGAVVIDTLFEQREIVIKNLGSHLRHVKGISGATVLGDGKVIPILNLEELYSSGRSFDDPILSEVQPEVEKTLEIMVVDDSVSIRQVVTRMLQKQGWKTQTARDGMEALEKLIECQPDLIVLDVEMPRMNGYEFLSALRAQSNFQDIPIIMLTSRTAVKHREKAKALGAKGYMVKPYKDEEFIDLIRSLT